jgi:excisionase family DNA binding protein
MSSGEQSLLIDDAATLLGVSRRTVYYRIREGKLQTIHTRCGSQRVLVSSIRLLLGGTGAIVGVPASLKRL